MYNTCIPSGAWLAFDDTDWNDQCSYHALKYLKWHFHDTKHDERVAWFKEISCQDPTHCRLFQRPLSCTACRYISHWISLYWPDRYSFVSWNQQAEIARIKVPIRLRPACTTCQSLQNKFGPLVVLLLNYSDIHLNSKSSRCWSPPHVAFASICPCAFMHGSSSVVVGSLTN